MSALTKKRPTEEVSIMVSSSGEPMVFKLSGKNAKSILKLLAPYQEENSISWDALAATRIKKYSEPGLALRGARVKEGLSQADLSKKTGIAQYNLSKMENGERPIGKSLAKRLSKILNVDYRIFL